MTSFGDFEVEVIDPVADYLAQLKDVFDFDLLRGFVSRSDFRMVYDALHAITGVYAKPILVDELGAPEDALRYAVSTCTSMVLSHSAVHERRPGNAVGAHVVTCSCLLRCAVALDTNSVALDTIQWLPSTPSVVALDTIQWLPLTPPVVALDTIQLLLTPFACTHTHAFTTAIAHLWRILVVVTPTPT